MDPARSRAFAKRLTSHELRRLAECLDHALTKPHLELTELVPTLVRGHHQISDRKTARILAAIRDLREEELAWLCDHIHDMARQ